MKERPSFLLSGLVTVRLEGEAADELERVKSTLTAELERAAERTGEHFAGFRLVDVEVSE